MAPSKRDEASARRWRIMTYVQRKGSVGLAAVKALFGGEVSEQAIRNDIAAIAGLPPFERDPTHGGLKVKSDDLFAGTYFATSMEAYRERKQALAKALVTATVPRADGKGVEPLLDLHAGSIVAGPGSSVIWLLAELAARHSPVQVTTPNFGIITMPHVITDCLHLTGGWLHRHTACLLGQAAVSDLLSFSSPVSVIGLSGFAWNQKEHDFQMFAHHEAQIPVKRALIQGRDRVVVLATGDKVAVPDAWRFADLGEILAASDFCLVTDGLGPEKRQWLEQHFRDASETHPHRAHLVLADQKG